MSIRRIVLTWSSCFCVVSACVVSRASAGPQPQPDFGAAAQQHIAEREYWASRSQHGLQAPNRRHDLRVYFEPDGIRVSDRTTPNALALLELRLEGIGRGALASLLAGSLLLAALSPERRARRVRRRLR